MGIELNEMPKLGFGLMRLPEKDGEIDISQVEKMVDAYMETGMNYFDTAYVYHGGKSESARHWLKGIRESPLCLRLNCLPGKSGKRVMWKGFFPNSANVLE